MYGLAGRLNTNNGGFGPGQAYDRVAIFNCYNSLWAQWHKLNLTHEQVMAMPPLHSL